MKGPHHDSKIYGQSLLRDISRLPALVPKKDLSSTNRNTPPPQAPAPWAVLGEAWLSQHIPPRGPCPSPGGQRLRTPSQTPSHPPHSLCGDCRSSSAEHIGALEVLVSQNDPGDISPSPNQSLQPKSVRVIYPQKDLSS